MPILFEIALRAALVITAILVLTRLHGLRSFQRCRGLTLQLPFQSVRFSQAQPQLSTPAFGHSSQPLQPCSLYKFAYPKRASTQTEYKMSSTMPLSC